VSLIGTIILPFKNTFSFVGIVLHDDSLKKSKVPDWQEKVQLHVPVLQLAQDIVGLIGDVVTVE